MQPLKYLDEMLPWNDRLQMLECISAIEEAPDVMTFSFKTAEDNWFRYTPGQFVTLELPIERADGLGPVLRTYTLSRSEEHTSELQSRENLVCRLLLEKINT